MRGFRRNLVFEAYTENCYWINLSFKSDVFWDVNPCSKSSFRKNLLPPSSRSKSNSGQQPARRKEHAEDLHYTCFWTGKWNKDFPPKCKLLPNYMVSYSTLQRWTCWSCRFASSLAHHKLLTSESEYPVDISNNINTERLVHFIACQKEEDVM